MSKVQGLGIGLLIQARNIVIDDLSTLQHHLGIVTVPIGLAHDRGNTRATHNTQEDEKWTIASDHRMCVGDMCC